MIRSRFLRTVLVLAGMAGVMYVLASMFLPSSRRLIFGVDKYSGRVRMVRQNVTFLPPHRFYRLSFEKREGAAQRDGIVRITSQEGVPVNLTYRLRFTMEGDRLADARRLVTDGWSAWIRARVSEALAAVTSQVPIEELLSPSSRFNAQREPLRRVVSAHLAQSGLQVTAFEIARVDPDRDALLRYKRAEVRRGARGVAGRVALFAIDGADWDLIQELADDERIPNLEALIKNGTTGTVQTVQPTIAPLVWTTAATGVTPDRHGVIDFFDRGNGGPVNSFSRRAPALWQIAEAFGRDALVVNWWTAWPPPPEQAVIFGAPLQLLPEAIHPEELSPRVQAAQVPASTIGYDQARRFLNITASEYQAAIENPTDPTAIVRQLLAKTWTDQRVALQLYREQQPLLFMMNFEGTDIVNHLFAPYHPPYREGMSQEGYRKYWPTVANYYAEIDRLLGEWMQLLPEDTTVMIVSGHGFKWSRANRPRQQPAGRAAISDHRNTGLFIAYGNHVAPSRASHTLSIYDLAPTILALLGLPKSEEMPGQVAQWAFKNVAAVQSVRVVSYNEFVDDRPLAGGARVAAEPYRQQLQAVGHVIDPSRGMTPVLEEEQEAQASQPLDSQQWGSYAWYNNTGVELRKQQKTKEAVEHFQKAIDLNPNRPAPYLNMAMTMFDRQQYTAAEEVFLQAVTKGLPNPDRWFVDFAALYRQNNMTSRAINLLYKGKEMFPQSSLIAANLGSALMQADRYTDGLPELERALALQPSSTMAMNNLGIYYAKKNDYGRALDFWNRSLTIDPRQREIRTAAEAARTHL